MLNLLDEVLRRVITSGWSAPPALPALSFSPPDDGFRSRLSELTLNIYLTEIRENRDFRRSQFDTIALGDRSLVRSQPPAYFDCHYLISAWSPADEGELASPVADEHALLGAALRVLIRNPDVNPGALGVAGGGPVFQEAHVYLTVAAPDGPRVVNDFWSTMKQPWRPAIALVATAPVDPLLDAPAGPPVVTFVQRTGLIGAATFDELVHIGGWVLRQGSDQPIPGATVRSLSSGKEVTTDAQGRFSFADLRPGIYRFRASAPGRAPLEQDIDVPGGDAQSHVFRLT
ncbi:Pvc16 family protein [Sorangium sp. So ce542]|uniref:Pvc16 family protein n=1 Tax=Sorangium sp. So ce542 TaxID=3133316 RepID=UPI003F5EC051